MMSGTSWSMLRFVGGLLTGSLAALTLLSKQAPTAKTPYNKILRLSASQHID
jgi:hypothetical protein